MHRTPDILRRRVVTRSAMLDLVQKPAAYTHVMTQTRIFNQIENENLIRKFSTHSAKCVGGTSSD